MEANRGSDLKLEKGPKATYETFARLRAEHKDALAIATNAADRRYLKGAIASIDEILKSLKTKGAKRKKPSAARLREIDTLTDRERVMAKLARKVGRGSDVIYHGTCRLPDVLRC